MILCSYYLIIYFNILEIVNGFPWNGRHKYNKSNIKKVDKRNYSSKEKSFLKFYLEYQQKSYYATTLKVGNPPENITVLFDTGSADTWLMNSKNPFCIQNFSEGGSANSFVYENNNITSGVVDCSCIDTFNVNASNSFKKLDNGRFYIKYMDDTFADGIWATESFTIDSISIPDVQIGLANYATIPLGGVLGLGFQRIESVTGYDGAPNNYYNNFPLILKKEGFINTVAYSLALGGDSHILFGAIDHNSYVGDLITFPMINMYPNIIDKPATLSLSIQGIRANNEELCQEETFLSTAYPVLLDSGTTFISAPLNIADKIAQFVNATWDENSSIYTLDCPANKNLNDTKYTFDFGDLQIDIPLNDFILSPEVDNGKCGFGLLRSDNEVILGDTFLQYAYVVYDLSHYQISLAKLNSNSNLTENIEEIPVNGSIAGAYTATALPFSTYFSSETTHKSTTKDNFDRCHKTLQNHGSEHATSTMMNSSSITSMKTQPTKTALKLDKIVKTVTVHETQTIIMPLCDATLSNISYS